MEQSFQNENKLSDNACEIFMDEVIMGKEPLKKQSKDHPSFFLIQHYSRRTRGNNENRA